MRPFIQRYPVLAFVAIALALQFAIVLFVHLRIPAGATLDHDATAHMVFRLRVFGPLLVAILVTYYLERKAGLRKLFSAFLHWRVPAKWYLFAFSWKFLFAYAGILGVWIIFGGSPQWVMQDFFWPLLVHMPFIIGIAVVEETSWIRFSMSRMQMRYNAFWSAMIVGNCWALWYLPMNLIDIGTPQGVPDIGFHVAIVTLIILLIWVYNTTRSGTVLLVMQIVSNMAFFVVPILPMSPGDSGRITAYVVVFILVAVALVVMFGTENLSRRKRVRWDEKEEIDEVEVSRARVVAARS